MTARHFAFSKNIARDKQFLCGKKKFNMDPKKVSVKRFLLRNIIRVRVLEHCLLYI